MHGEIRKMSGESIDAGKIVGHESQWQQLTGLFDSGKLTPAWMLCGPAGIGKASFAKAIAERIFLAANHVNVAIQMASGVFPNYKLISDEDGNITIDKLRPLIEFLQFKAHLPGWRVVIVDAADNMNRFAANALLKSLEEPPEQTLIMLIAHQPARILPTLRSRCLKLSFDKLSPEQVAESLGLSANNPAVQIADGRLGYTKFLHEQQLAAKFAELLRQITPAIAKRGALPMNFLKSFAKDNKESLEHLLEIWRWWVYQLAQPNGYTTTVWSDFYAEQRAMATHQHWLDVYQQLSNLFDRANRCHLDNYHVLLCAIETMKNPGIYNAA